MMMAKIMITVVNYYDFNPVQPPMIMMMAALMITMVLNYLS